MGIEQHLKELVASSPSTADSRNIFEKWNKLPEGNLSSLSFSLFLGFQALYPVTPVPSIQDDDSDVDQDAFESVLHLFQPSSSSDVQLPVISALLNKPNITMLIDPLLNLFASAHVHDPDVLSGQLLELLGFDDVDLIPQIIQNQEQVESFLISYSLHKPSGSDTIADPHDFSSAAVHARMAKQLEENASRPLFTGVAGSAPEILPHVYTSLSSLHGNILSFSGEKFALPQGTTRKPYELYEEVIVPPARQVPPKPNERLIPVRELDPLCKGSFPGYTRLNRIQSIVFPTAYGSNENMLVCAPTGAGKTDVAMLTILRVLSQHQTSDTSKDPKSSIQKNAFKIIYVAPMKALAAEIVRKLGKRLAWLGIDVRELTGDMQLTKTEIAQTQIIVTTPEKWDVVTRKPTGEGELASSLKLLIIDEVHLLNEDRGSVIETIVARTLRQVESTQKVIRIVGLSATLPNYIDVADFLSVSKHKGLFFFDSSFRPIPLQQHFIGVKGKPNTAESRKNMDTVAFEKVSELVEQGHQVMVFVHARKETVKTATALKEAAVLENRAQEFSCQDHPQFALFRRKIGESKNKEMKMLFDHGFGIHHAGMLRSDRNLMEKMFDEKVLKVLCCTATLAWGVNLPAHAVIIKGTQVYDSSRGAFVDLSVLDVLQIFGRAGRPGFETSGEGYICTTEDKLDNYLDAITSQHPIESQFKSGMIDALNAEISLGTVASTRDAVQWLGYTYLFVRMKRNPFVYGLLHDSLQDDPQLATHRQELVSSAARELLNAGMIAYTRDKEKFQSTDLGRIAARYYIRHASVEIFNATFRPRMTEADVLAMICKSAEFDQIQVRDSEIKELSTLLEAIPCDVKGVSDNDSVKISMSGQDRTSDKSSKVSVVSRPEKVDIPVHSKVNILLQSHISQLPIEDFALVSDTAYVAQNAGRITRALLEIAISRKMANVSYVLMGISKAIEKRLWSIDQPLRQFNLKYETLYALQEWADEYTPAELASMSAADLAKIIHSNVHHANAIIAVAKQFPSGHITYHLRPLGFDVLRISIQIEPTFTWQNKIHGGAQPFWLWVEDAAGSSILQMAHLFFRPSTKSIPVVFTIPFPQGETSSHIVIRFASDTWLGAEDEIEVSMSTLVLPRPPLPPTPLLDIPFLPLSSLRNEQVELKFKPLTVFNAMQTQSFWSFMRSGCHALFCAPTACGKSTLLHILIWMTLTQSRSKTTLIIIVTPQKHVALETASEIRSQVSTSKVSVELCPDGNIFEKPSHKTVRIVTGSKLLDFQSSCPTIAPPPINLVVCENLEQLDGAYELGVSLLLHTLQGTPTRFVGLSASLSEAADLASWLHVDSQTLNSFRPTDREQSLTTSTELFSLPHSTALLKVMAKPAHAAIQSTPAGESAIVFVSSRHQCRSVALDLITQSMLQNETMQGYLPLNVSEAQIESYLVQLQDRTLVDIVTRGIGFFHEGLSKRDRILLLELFAEGIVKVLITPRECCWTLPVRASTVVVMGTQYMVMDADGHREVRDYSLVELVRMQGRAIRHHESGHFWLFCHTESKATIMRFLNEGLPLESELQGMVHLERWLAKRKEVGHPSLTKQDLVDLLSFTFLSRRIMSNPSYYDHGEEDLSHKLSRIVDNLIEL